MLWEINIKKINKNVFSSSSISVFLTKSIQENIKSQKGCIENWNADYGWGFANLFLMNVIIRMQKAPKSALFWDFFLLNERIAKYKNCDSWNNRNLCAAWNVLYASPVVPENDTLETTLGYILIACLCGNDFE